MLRPPVCAVKTRAMNDVLSHTPKLHRFPLATYRTSSHRPFALSQPFMRYPTAHITKWLRPSGSNRPVNTKVAATLSFFASFFSLKVTVRRRPGEPDCTNKTSPGAQEARPWEAGTRCSPLHSFFSRSGFVALIACTAVDARVHSTRKERASQPFRVPCVLFFQCG